MQFSIYIPISIQMPLPNSKFQSPIFNPHLQPLIPVIFPIPNSNIPISNPNHHNNQYSSPISVLRYDSQSQSEVSISEYKSQSQVEIPNYQSKSKLQFLNPKPIPSIIVNNAPFKFLCTNSLSSIPQSKISLPNSNLYFQS